MFVVFHYNSGSGLPADIKKVSFFIALLRTIVNPRDDWE